MKRSFLWLLLLPLAAFSQTALQEIQADIHRSASNYLAYPEPVGVVQTPAPKGYKPFYFSHYARHGSRWHIGEGDYRRPFETLKRAARQGKLTAEGQRVLTVLDSVYRMSRGRLGELTPLGALQHRGIARRMVNNFPEIFRHKNLEVNARSTIVIRCILSMMNEALELQTENPTVRITSDASQHDMYYMNYEVDDRLGAYRKNPEIGKAMAAYRREHLDAGRLMGVIFNDAQYVADSVKAESLWNQIFNVAANMQSLETDMDLYGLFTTEECYRKWAIDNMYWYMYYGPSHLTKGKMPFYEANLLRNILETADSCLKLPQPSATLRFGHEVVVMPLACLLELDNYGKTYYDFENLDAQWRNYKVFPMASNIQWIFYKKKGSDDILVKIMLNEHETRLPVASDVAPYYHWKDVEAYYRAKLDNFKFD
ncbi:MAG: histidine acid phosphatase [Bacteroidaceae bacterium]|nr:histidine acid phosphatase [Bacteroidaceae bacterium]MDY6250721.1 histidine acid phosphatase [Bacteroidaceae bacterium]